MILPDFIIAGVMKCGTSSLHHILSQHPDVFIPKPEIHFYDMDDILQHVGFFDHGNNKWYWPDFERNPDKYLEWYSSFFEEASDDKILGEDSTTYIASDIAAKRISEINPHAKIIIMLRDPASRSYSHYFHLLRTGRVTQNFEDSILNKNHTIIQRSLYRQQIENFMKYIPGKQIKFVIFERFVKNMEKVLTEICDFIGADSEKNSLPDIDTHQNKTKLPRSINTQLIMNRLFQGITDKMKYSSHLPYDMPIKKYNRLAYRIGKKVQQKINPLTKRDKPKMKRKTRFFLNDYFKNINNGLNELIGFKVDSLWYK